MRIREGAESDTAPRAAPFGSEPQQCTRCGPCAGNQVGLTGLMRNWGVMSKQCQRVPSIVFVREVILFGVVGPAQHAKAEVDFPCRMPKQSVPMRPKRLS